MRTTLGALGFTLAATVGVAACEGPQPVPENPTWIRDVYPIVQGNCAHCHGPDSQDYSAGQKDGMPNTQYDFYDLERCGSDFAQFPGIGGFGLLTWKMYLKGSDPRMRMPPRPAEALTSEQTDTILKWLVNRDRGSRDNNRQPDFRLVDGLKVDNGRLAFRVDVSDADGDQVIGLVKLDNKTIAEIRGVGRLQVSDVDVSSLNGDTDLQIALCDGQDVRNDTIGTVRP